MDESHDSVHNSVIFFPVHEEVSDSNDLLGIVCGSKACLGSSDLGRGEQMRSLDGVLKESVVAFHEAPDGHFVVVESSQNRDGILLSEFLLHWPSELVLFEEDCCRQLFKDFDLEVVWVHSVVGPGLIHDSLVVGRSQVEVGLKSRNVMGRKQKGARQVPF